MLAGTIETPKPAATRLTIELILRGGLTERWLKSGTAERARHCIEQDRADLARAQQQRVTHKVCQSDAVGMGCLVVETHDGQHGLLEDRCYPEIRMPVSV